MSRVQSRGGSDYEPVVATFPVGVATIDIQLKPIWDDRVEGDEIVKFKLNANDSYQTNVFTDFALITIKDSAIPLVSIATQHDAREEDPFGNPEPGYIRISRWTGSNLRPLSVAYHIDSSSTATLNEDYQGTSYNGVALIPAGQSYVDVAVVPKQDTNNQEQTEWVDYSLVVSTKYQFVDPSTRLLIEDSPLPRVRVQAIDSNAAEPANGVTDTGTFVVTRVGRLNQSLTVQLEVSGTATVGADFTSNPALSSGSITVAFEAWESSRTITITPVADQQHLEEVESVNLSVALAAGYAIEAGYEQAIVNLADAPDLMIVEIYAVNHETGESIAPYMNMGDPITFPPGKAVVARSGRTDEAVTVQVHVAGTATFGTDYTSTVIAAGSTISVEFAAGEMLKYIEFTPITDTLVELDETILLSVSETASYHVGEHSADMITIHDNHPTVTVVATDRFATENSTEPGSTYNDNGEFTFTRVGGDLWTPLTVSFVLSGTAMNYMDYWAYTPDGTNLITIPSGQMSAVLTVYPSMDMMPGGFESVETVILTLSTSSSYAVGTPSSDTILIADAQNPTYIVTAIDPEATEPYSGSAEDSGMFEIRRLGGSFLGANTISFTLGGSAVQNSDYSVSSYLTVTIPAGRNGVTVAIIPNSDGNFAENAETVTLRLSDYFIGDEYVGPPELQQLAQATVTIQPAVNHAPTFETTFDSLYTLLEDANSAMGIDFHVDDQETPAYDLGVTASVVPAGLINVSVITPPAGAGGDRQLQIVPLANQFGTATVTLRVTDANGVTETQTLQVKVNSVNDAPSFTAGSDVTINEDSGRQSIPNWATNQSSGPLNESGQSLTFEITGHTIQGAAYGSLSELFEELPQISPSGTLTFKSALYAHGEAVVTVRLKDNGGANNGGVNYSDSVTFNIIVVPVPLPNLTHFRLNNDTGSSNSDRITRDPSLFYSIIPDPQPVNGNQSSQCECQVQIDVGCDGIIDFTETSATGIVDITTFLQLSASQTIEIQARTYRPAMNGQPSEEGTWSQLVFHYVIGKRPPIGSDKTYVVTVGDTLTIGDPLSILPQGMISDAWDPDGDSFRLTTTGDAHYGELQITWANGSFTYTPHDDINLNDYHEETLQFNLLDDVAPTGEVSDDYTLTIKIMGGNRAPTFTNPKYEVVVPMNYLEGDKFAIPMSGSVTNLATDLDADELIYSIDPTTPSNMFHVSDPLLGTLELSQDAIHATQAVYSLRLVATDPNGNTASADLKIAMRTVVGIAVDNVAAEGDIDKIRITFVRYTTDINVALEVRFLVRWAGYSPIQTASMEDLVAGPERDRMSPLPGNTYSLIEIPIGSNQTSIMLTAQPDGQQEGVQVFDVEVQVNDDRLPVDLRYDLPSRIVDGENANFKDPEDFVRIYAFARFRVVDGLALFGEYHSATLGSHDSADVDVNDVNQGNVGDCFLMAAFIALAKDNPGFLKQMFRHNPANPNEYIVNFKNDQDPENDETVSLSIDHGYAQARLSGDFDFAGNSEVWTILLEAAYSQNIGDEGYSNINGGTIQAAWTHITGRNATREAVAGLASEQIRDKIIAGMGQGKVVAIGTVDAMLPITDAISWVETTSKPRDVYEDHTYVVMDVAYYDSPLGANTAFVRLENSLSSQIWVRYDYLSIMTQAVYYLDSTH